jgi:hypothetical protein
MPGQMSERRYDVITCGDMCVDLIVTGSDVVPRFGQVEKLVDDYVVEMGGSRCIFACQPPAGCAACPSISAWTSPATVAGPSPARSGACADN